MCGINKTSASIAAVKRISVRISGKGRRSKSNKSRQNSSRKSRIRL